MKTCVITGATSGIGIETALGLARHDFQIIILGRNKEKCDELVRKITDQGGRAEYIICDLSLKKSIYAACEQIKKKFLCIDLLINNAGMSSDRSMITSEGLDWIFVTNYLSQFILIRELLPLVKKSDDGRIINVSSKLHYKAEFDLERPDFQCCENKVLKSYNQSKLLINMMTFELAEREKDSANLSIVCVHPGVVNTGIMRDVSSLWMTAAVSIVKPFLLTPEQGAQTTLYAAMAPEAKGIKGQYLDEKKSYKMNKQVYNDWLRQKAWQYSESLL